MTRTTGITLGIIALIIIISGTYAYARLYPSTDVMMKDDTTNAASSDAMKKDDTAKKDGVMIEASGTGAVMTP